ncbi:hypothetical protein [Nocardia sp. NPDC051570]|uniref:hypothetical protein n=1 Tax=Nocardia sp. NPDC051570 TaxID=3364324 RepID=UPI00378CDE0E
MHDNDIQPFRSRLAQRLEDEAIDAVVDLRARRRCHYNRAGLDPVTAAVQLWAETGHVPGWNDSVDNGNFDDGEGWAA